MNDELRRIAKQIADAAPPLTDDQKTRLIHLFAVKEPAVMDAATKQAWQIIQESPTLGAGLVRRVRQAFGHDLDVMKEGQTWIVVVHYAATPASPHAEPDGPMPDEVKGRLISAGVHGDRTTLTAEVVADNKPVAERIALGVVRWWAHIYGLPEPSRVHVMDN
ncbi:hypothetical protein [Micromonospora sp. CB01531]|uniref:hypothetical protein n=1 Tax=Micromonospora sp. CB01531 TaxID=1718947 RepID=UPI00093A6A0B|nr:hypothetical protein [Micromonospora sp. CB01531]OKI45136.1 hypothetical protein A6A27_12050 [Micromonospora sp. CB01531]